MSVMRVVTFILCTFIVGMVEMMVAGIMNLMSHDLHVSEAIIGQLVTLYAITFAVAGPILVRLTTHFRPKPLLLWTLVFFIIGNIVIAIAPNFTLLVIGRIVSSAAAALIIVKILALTAMLTTPMNRGKMIGIVYSGFSGANVLGVPIGTMIGGALGWRYTFVFIVAVSLIAGVLMFLYLPYLKPPTSKNANRSMSNQSNHATVLRPAEVAKYLAITFLILVANSITFIYINPLMLKSGHTLSFVSIVLLINGVAGVAGTSMGGFLSDRLTSKRWLIISIISFIIMMSLLNQLLATSIILILGIFIWNIMQWSTNPAVQSGIIDQVEGDTSQVMSWNMSSLNAGIGVGSIVGGLVVSNLSVYATTYFSAGIGVLVLIIAISLKQTLNYSDSEFE
ncbi:MFS transporter [Staphylococcus sp. SQ8-PEA]|uniref:MFS transporter n=1 Tax=Staphylococcus marylandisciuri TaxID=2981529 RepID=A0ABT2QMW0_9STAP|nr:MFS transporter [Staphylococcus marylandisciuri]MCU5745313.1 MFS transporter [Staphylococcus marylandisciuri]